MWGSALEVQLDAAGDTDAVSDVRHEGDGHVSTRNGMSVKRILLGLACLYLLTAIVTTLPHAWRGTACP